MQNISLELQIQIDDATRILRMLAYRKGKAGLFVLDVGDADTPSFLPIVEELVSRSGCRSVIIDMSSIENVEVLVQAIRTHADSGVELVHLLNTEAWLLHVTGPKGDAEAYRWSHLNRARESLFGIAVILTMPMTPSGIKDLARKAPDFFSWRTGIYDVPTAFLPEVEVPGELTSKV